MRICYIVPFVNKTGGTERYFAELIERLSHSHEITVLANRVDDLKSRKYRHIKIPVVKKPGILLFFTFFLFNNLVSLFIKKRFDIIHSSGGDSIFSNVTTFQFCQVMRRDLQKKGIIQFKITGPLSLLRKIHYTIYANTVTFIEKAASKRKSLKRAIGVSNGIRNILASEYGIDPIKTSTIYNGVDLEQCRPPETSFRNKIRQKLKLPDNHKVFIFIGGDWERKGLSFALKAFSSLNKSDTNFLIVGSGDKKTYVALCDELGINDRVSFIGKTNDIAKYLSASDIFVFPTLYEPFGIAPLEAMACGLPTIVSKTAGVSESIENEKDGILLNDPTDDNEIYQAMLKLYENKGLLSRFGKYAAVKAKQFSWDKIVEKTVTEYERTHG